MVATNIRGILGARMADLVRKGGLEPPRELPHWNLNAEDVEVTCRNYTNRHARKGQVRPDFGTVLGARIWPFLSLAALLIVGCDPGGRRLEGPSREGPCFDWKASDSFVRHFACRPDQVMYVDRERGDVFCRCVRGDGGTP